MSSNSLLMVVLLLTAMFLIVLVLIQRGKGGGLAGAFGGMGGQSAFGTKAGDLFTRITIGVATFWILLCLFAVWKLSPTTMLDESMGKGAGGVNKPASASAEGGASETPAAGKSSDAGKPAEATDKAAEKGSEKAAEKDSTTPGDSK